MTGEKVNPSKVDSTPVNVKYEDIPEESRKQFEALLKKEQEEATKRLLACYGKTRQGVIEKEKFVMPTFTPPPPNPSTTTIAATSSASTTSNVSFHSILLSSLRKPLWVDSNNRRSLHKIFLLI